jgi:hypothetical protein
MMINRPLAWATLLAVSELAAPGGNEELANLSVADDVAGRIISGSWPAGRDFGPSATLLSTMDAATARSATPCKSLRDRALIRTVHGRGTYLA